VGFRHQLHDAILDGWSTALMVVEILQQYAALLVGSAPIAPPPPIAYRDYVALERQAIESQACQQYWSAKLSDWVLLRLPRRRAAPSEPAAPQMGVLDVAIAADVSDGLQRLARLARVSLKHVLLAAHLRVMRLLGGQPDVLTGLESNGRLEEINGDQTIGIDLNSLPFRQRLAGGT
jgi:hypothetical protein